MSILDPYAEQYLVPSYQNYPQGLYVSVVLMRRVESEAIFRTEGSGEPLSKEFVHGGLDGGEIVQRVVISKRKQTAVERRTGRELLRRHSLLFETKEGICALNRNNPCGNCVDCMVYGYAAGGGGAQKSRVMTDDAFSLSPASTVTDVKTFNALYDNSTMRDPEKGKPSSSIGEDEYVKPETIFIDIETMKDVTADELRFILGNILRSSRYGAISSRIGKIKNQIVGVIFSDTELFSNLELTQAVFDLLRGEADEPDYPAREDVVQEAIKTAVATLMPRVVGRISILSDEEVDALVDELSMLYSDESRLGELLTRVTNAYPQNANK